MATEFGRVFDVSPVVHAGSAVFPGDVPFERQVSLDCRRGDTLTLSSIKTTVHVGAHADAPSHYSAEGQTIEQRSLQYYLGKAQVVSLCPGPGERIRVSHWGKRDVLAPRVLFHTGSFPNPDEWTDDFNSLSSELIEFLAERGVCLVGIDTPSIDPATDKELLSHHAVYRRNVAVLEGLVLNGVPDGVYDLIALPLALKEGDASPVRAVLLESKR